MKSFKILFNGFRHGHIFALYKRVAASSLTEVAGCIEQNAEARAQAEAKLGISFSEECYEKWLASDIAAVAVGGAYGERGAVIIKALEAGKHVIADKPVCTTRKELETIRALCAQKGLTVACMLDLRYLPQALTAKRILDSGRLGAIRNIAFNGQHCIDYANRPAWYFEEGMHGGTLNDLSIHGVDLVRMLTGQEIVQVDAARVWNSYAVKHKDFKDSAMLMARLESGAGVLADVSYSAPSQVFSMPTYWEFRVWCEKGLLSFSFTDSAVTLYEEGSAAPVRIEGESNCESYLTEFLSEIQNGTGTVTENVLRSTETALMLQETADKEWQK